MGCFASNELRDLPPQLEVKITEVDFSFRDLAGYSGSYKLSPVAVRPLYEFGQCLLYEANGFWTLGDSQMMADGGGLASTREKHQGRNPDSATLTWRIFHQGRREWVNCDCLKVSRQMSDRELSRIRNCTQRLLKDMAEQGWLQQVSATVALASVEAKSDGDYMAMPMEAVTYVITPGHPAAVSSLAILYEAANVTKAPTIGDFEMREVVRNFAELGAESHPEAVASAIVTLIEGSIAQATGRLAYASPSPMVHPPSRQRLHRDIKAAGAKCFREVQAKPLHYTHLLVDAFQEPTKPGASKAKFKDRFFSTWAEVSGMCSAVRHAARIAIEAEMKSPSTDRDGPDPAAERRRSTVLSSGGPRKSLMLLPGEMPGARRSVSADGPRPSVQGPRPSTLSADAPGDRRQSAAARRKSSYAPSPTDGGGLLSPAAGEAGRRKSRKSVVAVSPSGGHEGPALGASVTRAPSEVRERRKSSYAAPT
eukprot:TRINITY_DN65172_c0_g1_i1.p1 TRINITY_DN65172_c0_g1~~TRINITY_DN65172_c0_g1_i1.p1  ORF type:complete len:480 (+),score=117.32 TRINITY_DN65172_c0_g1_i1:112-1551(+)